MRNVDPFAFFRAHQDTIYRWLGVAGVLLLIFLLLRIVARRLGGWRRAWHRARREVAVTAYAFVAPVRTWLVHRRDRALLRRLLGDPVTWRDAERALTAARLAAAPARPYAVLVGTDSVRVLLAGRDVPDPTGCWHEVTDTAGEWRASRDELPLVTPEADAVPPLLIALGATDTQAAFLDAATGPASLCIEGHPQAASPLLQAIAAQLDARLPASLVVVAEGVHRDFDGPPVREAYRTAEEALPRLNIPPFLIATELPDPLPAGLASPRPPCRVVLLGAGRGHTRTLLTDRHGQVLLTGTPLLVRAKALGRALPKVLWRLPAVLPPAPMGSPSPERQSTDLFEEEPAAAWTAEPGASVPPPWEAPAGVPAPQEAGAARQAPLPAPAPVHSASPPRHSPGR
ncbi:hypothetical protein ABT127_21525 [Streptomyces sp. NPDC001904]|uniref:hypothetical protein n=1 Tax=Streptomyces sp. NPDC001904 TaxID=3154531 RepID=UPI00332553C6